MRHAMVTGGSGFIGTNLVGSLLANGFEVTVLDIRPPKVSGVRWLAVDVTDLEGLRRSLVGIDVVFHLAAEANVQEVQARPAHALHVNVQGTANLFDAARSSSVRRIILASTVWVYGGAMGSPPFSERFAFDLNRPQHLYTTSKLAAEMIGRSYSELYGLEYTVLRYGIPYGPFMRPELLLPTVVSRALRGEPIMVNGSGTQTRNYLYVEDLCAAHLMALGDAGVNATFNLEGSEPISVLALIETVAAVLDRPLRIVTRDARAGEFSGAAVNSEATRRLLNWMPTTAFVDGVRGLVERYEKL